MTGYSEEGDLVVLRMTREDYAALIFLLGFAEGSEKRNYEATPGLNRSVPNMATKLANRINEGNPYWTPYKLSEEGE